MEKASSVLKSHAFWAVVGGAALAIGGYLFIVSRGGSNTTKEINTDDKVRMFIDKEMKRLKRPKLIICEGVYGEVEVLKRDDFFDILLVIQLNTKLELSKEVWGNQRERVKLLEAAVYPVVGAPENAKWEAYDKYFAKAMDIMQREFDHYED